MPTWAALAMLGARVWLPMSENTPEAAGSTEPEYSSAARTTKVAIWARVTERPGENAGGPVPARMPPAARRLIGRSRTEPCAAAEAAGAVRGMRSEGGGVGEEG